MKTICTCPKCEVARECMKLEQKKPVPNKLLLKCKQCGYLFVIHVTKEW